jgi:hypothetical protein
VDFNFLVGKKMNLKYVEAFKGRGRMSKNRGYNVVCLGLLVESISSNLFFCKCGVEFLLGGEGGGGDVKKRVFNLVDLAL